MTRIRDALAPSDREESGTVLVIVTVMMSVLLAFAALAVDVGNQFVHRHTAQGAVDAAVLAGAIEVSWPGATPQEAVDVVKQFIDQNLDLAITNSQWENDCIDPTPLDVTAADLGLVPATDCISFGLDEIRVSLPELELETYFATVMGIDSLPYSASANAAWVFPAGTNPPPFVVPIGVDGGDEVCLRTNPSPVPIPPQFEGNGFGAPATMTGALDPCDDTIFTAGGPSFGTLNPYFYSEPDPAAPNVQCTQPGANVIDYGIAAGIDHIPGAFEPDYAGGSGVSASNPVSLEGVNCPQNAPRSNTFDLQTGLTAQKLRCGLISTASGTCRDGPEIDSVEEQPRLHRGEFVQSTYTFSGEDMDNTPLWRFIHDDIAAATVPSACVDAYVYQDETTDDDDYYDVKALMLTCLSQWGGTPNADPIFDDSLMNSGRFAFIPRMDESNYASSPIHINDYVPVFLQTLYQGGKSQGAPNLFCWTTTLGGGNPDGWYRHEAGQDFDCGRDNDTLDRVSAIVIPCAALPQTVCVDGSGPGEPGGEPVLSFGLTQ